jgi:hypothetical protein
MILDAFEVRPGFSSIDQIDLQRDWMDRTFDRHAYHCFPMTLANRLGWGISYPEDISFIWDGEESSESGHVEIITGHKYAYTGRENATISFNTGIIFSPDKNISLLTMPAPNQFISGAQCITTIVSTSALIGDIPIAWKITNPNEKITIKAGTPIAAILPISISDINNMELVLHSGLPESRSTKDYNDMMRDRAKDSQEKNKRGVWTHFYRDAKDHLGRSFGSHEAKKIIMRVTRNAKS